MAICNLALPLRLPSLQSKSVLEKGCLRQRLGEDVRHLVCSGDGQHCDVLPNVRSEEVEPLVDVLGPGPVLGVVGNFNCPTVVLEDSAVDLCFGSVHQIATLCHLLKDPDHR